METISSLTREFLANCSVPVNIPTTHALLGAFRSLHKREHQPWRTLLAVSANSPAAVKAALLAAWKANCPMAFVATLNQVDRDRGYTGWNHVGFLNSVRHSAESIGYKGLISLGLDHAGPWCKDKHSKEAWPYLRTTSAVKRSLAAAIDAGFDILHIDPTIDRDSSTGEPSIKTVIERTVELIGYCEKVRTRLARPQIAYEVGTEEVKGGLADYATFNSFIIELRWRMMEAGLAHAWPCFIVGKVGTNLYKNQFDFNLAKRLADIASDYGLALKGHYTDNVNCPERYPESRMGGANIGPEFTQVEYEAMQELEEQEKQKIHVLSQHSQFSRVLSLAVVESCRWQKWLLPDEKNKPFEALGEERQKWLLTTGARYVWSHPLVLRAREKLYRNLGNAHFEPEDFVVQRIASRISRYCQAFNLEDTLPLLNKEFKRRSRLPFWGTGDIVGIGESIVEIMRPSVDKPLDKTGRFLGPFPSGAPAICADAAAKVGKRVAFIGSVDNDSFGRLLTERLSTDGVYTNMIRISRDGSTGCAFVAYAGDGSRKFIFHITGTASDKIKTDNQSFENVASFRHCHLMGCSLAMSRQMRTACIQIAQAVKNAGGSISLDPNLRPELLSLEEYRTILQPVVAMSDILLPSGDELTLLTGEKDTEQACRQLLLSNVKIIVLKLGVRGCRIYTRDNTFEVPGFKIKAIDPTGAGDCFDAGFISAYLDGLPLQLAASFANALGALGTTRRGAMEGTFSLKEVMAFIRCHSE